MTPQCRHAWLGAVACIAFAGGIAPCASITETVPFIILAPGALNLPAQTVIVPTPQFNPMLGTLQGATTTIAGTISTALEFFTTGAGGQYDVLLTDTISLAGIPALFGQELTGAIPAGQPVFALPVTFPFGPVDRSDPAELVFGSGTWNQLFSLPYPSLVVTQSPATAVLVPGLMISGTSVTTYAYTPATAAIPEPRSAALIALIFALGLVARNKRRWGKNAWGLHPERFRGEV